MLQSGVEAAPSATMRRLETEVDGGRDGLGAEESIGEFEEPSVGSVRRVAARERSLRRAPTGPEERLWQRRHWQRALRLRLFRIFRILFALLSTTLLGPIVLVALIAGVAYRYFFTGRR